MSMYVDAVPVLYIADWLVQQSHTPRRQLWACGEQVCGCAEKKKIPSWLVLGYLIID